MCRKTFTVLPDVFSPAYFRDTEWLTESVLSSVAERTGESAEGHRFLEIGCGAGVTTTCAALEGCDVTAVDINPEAVANTIENARLHHVEERVHADSGNIFTPLYEGAQFDTIYWNVPFGMVDDESPSLAELSVLDPGYKAIRDFLHNATRFLDDDGRVLVGFSDTIGEPELLLQFAREGGLDMNKRDSMIGTEVHPVTFDMYEGRKRSNLT